MTETAGTEGSESLIKEELRVRIVEAKVDQFNDKSRLI
jgi:hypothetical protein